MGNSQEPKCAICGRPAWGPKARRRWFDFWRWDYVTEEEHFCIYHHPSKEKTKDFWRIFQKNWEQERNEENPFGLIERAGEEQRFYDFTNFFFPKDANFSGKTFAFDANFFGAVFEGHVSFLRTIFNRGVNFERVAFKEDAYFREAVFDGDVSFEGAAFSGHVFFERSTFS